MYLTPVLLGFIIDLLDCFLLFVFACMFVDDYIVVLNELYHCSFVPKFDISNCQQVQTYPHISGIST